MKDYREQRQDFAKHAPSSAAGKTAAKQAAAKEMGNLTRSVR
jgi:hypothetical protein